MTDGTAVKKVRKHEVKSFYEAGWWFVNIKRRYPGVVKRDFGIDLEDLSSRLGYVYKEDWTRYIL